MTNSKVDQSVTRRTALSGLGAASLGLALFAKGASAQEATPFTGHVQIGVWMIESGIGRAIGAYTADGTVVTALTPTQAGPGGVSYASTQIGVWEPTGPRTTHITVAQLLSDETGAYAGSVTIDAFQEISEDGQSWASGAGTSATIRDAADNVVQVIGDDAPGATAVRMTPGFSGFPEPTPNPGTPEA